MEAIKKFIKDEDGMELSEYAIVGGILLVAIIAVIGLWGQHLTNIFTDIKNAMATADAAG